mgnify:CR=1 FL=1
MREKAVSRSREHSKDVALCGLFAALVAVGAFIKVVIPTGADTMNFTLQWFFVMLAAFLLGSRRAFTSVGVYLDLRASRSLHAAAVRRICCARPLVFCWDFFLRRGSWERSVNV